MKHNMIVLFQNSQDGMNVDTLPAVLTLHEEHAKAILGEATAKHPHPRGTTVSIELSHNSFTKKPLFLPLERSLAKKFSTPDYITAIVDIHEKTFTVKLTYQHSDKGICSSESFYNDVKAVDDLACDLLTEEDMAEWLTTDCEDTAYIKEALGEPLFANMLSKMSIEEGDLQEAQRGI